MEVHHHPHPHSKKNWKEYFWEFLMLFLAVFCGFLAEYKLEHVIERNKETQFIKALVEDLKLDTIAMNTSFEINKNKISGMDTLERLIWDTPITKKYARRMYELKFSYTGSFAKVIFSRSTLTQLKYSGNLRLIQNLALADSIVKYDLASERMDSYASSVENFVEDNYKAEYWIFSDKFWPPNYKSVVEYEKADFDLISYDKKELTAYASRLKHQSGSMGVYCNRFILAQKQRASRLIALLKKEYHLE